MFPPLALYRPAFGYCCLASHTEEIISPAILLLGEKPKFPKEEEKEEEEEAVLSSKFAGSL